MKQNIFYIFFACILLFACKKDVKLTYDSPDNIYFKKDSTNVETNKPDTSVYSFAYNPSLVQDTVYMRVIVSGLRVNHDRKFAIKAIDSSTTAVSGVHYEALKPYYTMPKDSGKVWIPIILKNTDPVLATKSLRIGLLISGGEDFKTELPVATRTKIIVFSNRLEKPIWWDYWAQLPNYSRVAHQLFLISSGTKDLSNPRSPDGYLYTPRSLFYLENTRVFLTYPFDWVKDNADKGYVLTQRTNGSGDYDFYNTASPDKKFYLKYFSQADQYVFIDENGNQIKM